MPLKRKSIVTPSNKLKADVRSISRMALSLYKPNLKNPNQVSQKAARRADFIKKYSPLWFISKINVLPIAATSLLRGRPRLAKEELGMEPLGFAHPLTKRTRYGKQDKSYYKKRKSYRSTIAHEVVHSLGLSKNHLVTASALSQYLDTIHFQMRVKKDPDFMDLSLLKNRSNMRAIDSAYGSKRFIPLEHFSVTGLPNSTLGTKLGRFVATVEIQLNTPGLGGILLREISNGTPVKVAYTNAATGKYDLEATKWLERSRTTSPRITKYYFGQKN